MNNLSVITTSKSDPLISALANLPNVFLTDVDQLSKHISIGSWPKVIQSDFPDDIIDGVRGTLLFNRTFSINQTRLFERVTAGGYHHIWAHVALKPLLELSNGTVHDTGCAGVCRSFLPLPTQWFRIKNASPDVSIPYFFYGFGGEMPALDGFIDPMQKSVWSIFDWKVERSLSEVDRIWHRFFVERPTGVPVICYFVDPATMGSDGVGYMFPRGAVALPTDRITDLAVAVSQTFGSLIGEFLIFLSEEGEPVFHGFSPMMETGLSLDHGVRMIQEWAERRAPLG